MQPDIIRPNTPQGTDQTPSTSDLPEQNLPEQPSPAPLASPDFPEPQKSKRNKKKILIIVASLLALVGICVAAYFFLYLPNTPENIVKKSISNTLAKEKVSTKGVLSFKQNNSPAGVSFLYSAQIDKTKNAGAIKSEISVGEAKIPIEAVSVDNSVFFKVDDFSGISALATGFLGQEVGSTIDKIGKQVSGKWIELDQSTAQAAGAGSCTSALNTQFSQQDIDQIMSLYDKNSFVKVQNVSDDNIDGRKVKKAELSFDQDKAKAFGSSLESLDAIKKLKECGNNSATESASGTAQNYDDSSKITIWVDVSKKEIAKIALEGSDQESVANFDITFTEEAVDIKKPEGSVQFSQLMTQILPALSESSALQGTNFLPTP